MKWFVHLLSPLFLVGTESRPGLVTGSTKDSLDRFWAEEGEAPGHP
jgi:hypothetical protein